MEKKNYGAAVRISLCAAARIAQVNAKPEKGSAAEEPAERAEERAMAAASVPGAHHGPLAQELACVLGAW